MENPWKQLPENSKILSSDRDTITKFNSISSVDEKHKVHVELHPEPYLGRVDAEIVLLNLNPGFSSDDHSLYEITYAQEVWRKNLQHESLAYSFYLLDPVLQKYPGPRWWLRKLREPIEVSDVKTVANNVFCIEYFPYHSKKFKPINQILESQRYSFYLAEQAISRKAIIVLMRGKNFWYDAVRSLADYKSCFELNSAQNVSISRNNCPEGFPLIERTLKAKWRNDNGLFGRIQK